MTPDRFRHGPPLVAGILLGLLTARHVVVALVLAFAAGILIGRLWHTLGGLAGAARRRLERPALYDRELDP
jgi:hypothetical protein